MATPQDVENSLKVIEKQALEICVLKRQIENDMAAILRKKDDKIQDLETELRIVKRQLEAFQGRQMDEILQRRRAAMQFYREQYERTHTIHGDENTANSEEGLDEID